MQPSLFALFWPGLAWVVPGVGGLVAIFFLLLVLLERMWMYGRALSQVLNCLKHRYHYHHTLLFCSEAIWVGAPSEHWTSSHGRFLQEIQELILGISQEHMPALEIDRVTKPAGKFCPSGHTQLNLTLSELLNKSYKGKKFWIYHVIMKGEHFSQL